MKHLHSISSPRLHELVEDPAAADLILIGNLRDEERYARVRNHPLIARYPDKCFGICDVDHPMVLIRGLYSNVLSSFFHFGRARSGTFSLFNSDFINSYIPLLADEANRRLTKKYLLSFAGGNTHPVRDKACKLQFSRPDILIRDTSSFNTRNSTAADRENRRREYCEIIRDSKFSLCLRGTGVSTARIFESMELGVAPIIVADGWTPPSGPEWESFSIKLPEKEIGDIEKIAVNAEPRFAEMGARAREAFLKFFAPSVYFNYIVANCEEMRRTQSIPERFFWKLRVPFMWLGMAEHAYWARRCKMR